MTRPDDPPAGVETAVRESTWTRGVPGCGTVTRARRAVAGGGAEPRAQVVPEVDLVLAELPAEPYLAPVDQGWEVRQALLDVAQLHAPPVQAGDRGLHLVDDGPDPGVEDAGGIGRGRARLGARGFTECLVDERASLGRRLGVPACRDQAIPQRDQLEALRTQLLQYPPDLGEAGVGAIDVVEVGHAAIIPGDRPKAVQRPPAPFSRGEPTCRHRPLRNRFRRIPANPAAGIVYVAWARSSAAERGTFNPCVVGSNPTGLTTFHARTFRRRPTVPAASAPVIPRPGSPRGRDLGRQVGSLASLASRGAPCPLPEPSPRTAALIVLTVAAGSSTSTTSAA